MEVGDDFLFKNVSFVFVFSFVDGGLLISFIRYVCNVMLKIIN